MNLGEKETQLKDAGFSNTEIENWKKEKIIKLDAAGFTNADTLEAFGIIPADKNNYKNYFKDVKKEIENEYYQDEVMMSPDDDLLYQDQIAQGKQISTKEFLVGQKFDGDQILKRGYGKTLYDMTYRLANEKGLSEALTEDEPEDYTWFEGLLERAATLGLELPIYGLSFVPGTLAGGPYGGAFTAGAIPGAARSTILKGLEQQSSGQPVEILKNFLQEGIKEGAKQGVTFTATALAPQLKLPVVGKLADKYLTRVASQLTAFEGVGATLNGQLPTLKEFSYSAVLFGALGAVQPKKTMEKRTKEIFVDTGKKPNQVFTDSITNKRILEDVSSRSYVRDYKNLLESKISKKETVIIDKTKKLFKDDIANKAAENIAFKSKVEPLTAERLKEMGSTAKRKFIVTAIDTKYPILEALKDAGVNTKTGIEKLNIYEQTRLLEGMPNRAASFIEFSTLNFKTAEPKGPGLKTILKDVTIKGNKEMQLFDTYLANRRAIELNSRGIESGFDIATSKAFIKKYNLQFEQYAKKVDTYQRQLLEYAVDGGLISKDAFVAMTEANKNYVTFARELPKKGEIGFIKGSVNPFKRIKGSKERVFPPLEAIVKNTNTIVNLAERNQVKVNFVDFIAKEKKIAETVNAPDPFPYFSKTKPKLKPINIQRKELEQFFNKTEIDKMSDKTIGEFTIFRQEFSSTDKGQITVKRNGKTETYDVGVDLANAFKTLDQQGTNMLLNFLGAPARTLRAGAILIPDFAVPNFFRDTIQASFLNKVGFVPIQDSLIGAMNILTKGSRPKTMKLWERYTKSGGMQSTLLAVDKPNIFDGKVYDILTKGPVRNANKGMLAPLKWLTTLSEEATRFRIFEKTEKAALKKGLSSKDAMERGGYEARNLLDYAKRGTAGAAINKIVPFWNARVQGLTRVYEAFRDQPGRTSAMIGVTIVLPTIGFYIANMDDEDYKEQPEWLKQNYWYFKDSEGKANRIPKPFEVGTLVSSVLEKFLDWYRTNEPQEFDRFASEFLYNNAKSFNPIPTAIRPFIENFMNYSFFRDAPIVPKSLDKNLINKFYYTEYTSESIKLFSEILNGIVGDDSFLSSKPIHAENVFRSWTGGLGRYALEVLDYTLIKAKIIDDPIKPTDKLSKMPVIRAFDVAAVPGYSSKSLTRFFEELEKVEKIFNSMDFALKAGNNDEYKKLYATAPFDRQYLLKYKKSIKELDKRIRQIYNTKELADGTKITPDQKRELIDDQYRLMINFAQQALIYLEKTKKE
tara:strand:+ start:331 stop:4098 length:3768 start_codon:yes stop_codon:yes gene_type:complete